MDLGWISLTSQGFIQMLVYTVVTHTYLVSSWSQTNLKKKSYLLKMIALEIAKFIQTASHLENNWKIVVVVVG